MPSVFCTQPILSEVSTVSAVPAPAQGAEAAGSFLGVFQAVLQHSAAATQESAVSETPAEVPESDTPVLTVVETDADAQVNVTPESLPVNPSDTETEPVPQLEVRTMNELLTCLYPLPALILPAAQLAATAPSVPEVLNETPLPVSAIAPISTVPVLGGSHPEQAQLPALPTVNQTNTPFPADLTTALTTALTPESGAQTVPERASVLQTSAMRPAQVQQEPGLNQVRQRVAAESALSVPLAGVGATDLLSAATKPGVAESALSVSLAGTGAADLLSAATKPGVVESALSVSLAGTGVTARLTSATMPGDPESVTAVLPLADSLDATGGLTAFVEPGEESLSVSLPSPVSVASSPSLTAVSAERSASSVLPEARISSVTDLSSASEIAAIPVEKTGVQVSAFGEMAHVARLSTPQDYANVWLRTRVQSVLTPSVSQDAAPDVAFRGTAGALPPVGVSLSAGENSVKALAPEAAVLPSATALPVIRAVTGEQPMPTSTVSSTGQALAELSLKQQLGIVKPEALPVYPLAALQTRSGQPLSVALPASNRLSTEQTPEGVLGALLDSQQPVDPVRNSPAEPVPGAPAPIHPTVLSADPNTVPLTTAQAPPIAAEIQPQRTEAPVAAQARPEMPVAVLQQFGERIRLMRQDGRNEIRLSLKPAELGKISLQLIQQDQQLKMHILTETVMAKDLLESQLGQLKQSLQQQGFQVQQIQIEFQPGDSGQPFPEQRHPSHSHEQKSVYRGFWSDEDFPEDDSELDLSALSSVGRDASRQALHVNYLA